MYERALPIAALEHLVFLELKAYLDYRRIDLPLTFWRTHTGHEVDFLVGDDVAIEVKASRRVTRADVRGLVALNEDVPLRQRLVVSMEAHERTTDEGVRILPVTAFLSALWQDQLVGQSGAA